MSDPRTTPDGPYDPQPDAPQPSPDPVQPGHTPTEVPGPSEMPSPGPSYDQPYS
jgi:hypothetical protein